MASFAGAPGAVVPQSLEPPLFGLPSDVWLGVLGWLDNASQAEFALCCRAYYNLTRSGARILAGTLDGVGRFGPEATVDAMVAEAAAAWYVTDQSV